MRLEGKGTFGRFSTISDKGDIFMSSSLLSSTSTPFGKGSVLKGKNLQILFF